MLPLLFACEEGNVCVCEEEGADEDGRSNDMVRVVEG